MTGAADDFDASILLLPEAKRNSLAV